MIPLMTDTLGKYWKQPDRDDILVDEHSAVMTKESFAKLHNYEGSIPTGTYAGKMWRRYNYLRWYEDDPSDPNSMLIRSRKILIV